MMKFIRWLIFIKIVTQVVEVKKIMIKKIVIKTLVIIDKDWDD